MLCCPVILFLGAFDPNSWHSARKVIDKRSLLIPNCKSFMPVAGVLGSGLNIIKNFIMCIYMYIYISQI